MQGHIRRRGKRSWAIILDLGRDNDGKRKQKWHSFKGTKKDAEAELARIVTNINTGEYVPPSKMLVRDYLNKWLVDYVAGNTSPKTRERYKEMIDAHINPAIGGHLLSKLMPLHIQSFYTAAQTSGRKDGKGGLSAQSVLHFHRVLHKALSLAVRWQLLVRNPADAVQPPRPERKEMNALNEAETATMLKRLEASRLHVPVVIGIATGARRGFGRGRGRARSGRAGGRRPSLQNRPRWSLRPRSWSSRRLPS